VSIRTSLSLFLIGALLLVGGTATRPALAEISGSSILLVASTKMKDPRFERTVVVVTRHGRSAPLGVIINRPLGTPLGTLFPKLPDDEAKRPLFFGGPVATNMLVFLYRNDTGSDDSIMLGKDVYLGRSGVTLGEFLRGKRKHSGLRVFVGYAGWANEQLENEIRRGDWHVMPIERDVLFDKEIDQIWPELIRRASQQMVLQPSTTPSLKTS